MNDAEINVILELMGGVTDAKDIVLRALQSGKHVITANKVIFHKCFGSMVVLIGANLSPHIQALVAAHLTELEAEVSKSSNVSLGYEAAVCGGIMCCRTHAWATLSEMHLVSCFGT